MGNSVMLNGVEYAGEQIAYKDSTYELVSKVAYLIGVPLRIAAVRMGTRISMRLTPLSRCGRSGKSGRTPHRGRRKGSVPAAPGHWPGEAS